jgi:hypothetical protein
MVISPDALLKASWALLLVLWCKAVVMCRHLCYSPTLSQNRLDITNIAQPCTHLHVKAYFSPEDVIHLVCRLVVCLAMRNLRDMRRSIIELISQFMQVA